MPQPQAMPKPPHPPAPDPPPPPISPADAEDADLLRRFIAGDDSALGLLASRHERSLLGIALGLLRDNRDLAADAVQESWVRIIRHASTFDGRAPFRAWAARITVNCCRELWKRESRASRNARVPARPASDPPAADVSRAELHTALARLDDEAREILLLCSHRGLTHEAAAHALGIPIGTLKTRLYTGLRELRAALAREAQEASS